MNERVVFVNLGSGERYRLTAIREQLAYALGRIDEQKPLDGKDEAAIRNALKLLNALDTGCFLRGEATVVSVKEA